MEMCPCCSGKTLGECCGPILAGETAPGSAEALMRSRYTAYTQVNLEHLYATSGTSVRKEFDAENTRQWAQSATWQGLDVLKTSGGGEGDARGIVEFVAHYEINGKPCRHHEVAEFSRRNGRWLFEDSRIVGPDPHRREAPKVGRNAPCPCGSGRKFKRCCENQAASPAAE